MRHETNENSLVLLFAHLTSKVFSAPVYLWSFSFPWPARFSNVQISNLMINNVVFNLVSPPSRLLAELKNIYICLCRDYEKIISFLIKSNSTFDNEWWRSRSRYSTQCHCRPCAGDNGIVKRAGDSGSGVRGNYWSASLLVSLPSLQSQSRQKLKWLQCGENNIL